MKLHLIPQPKSITFHEGAVPVSPVAETLDSSLAPEVYVLTAAPDGIRLRAGSEVGLLWGQKTWQQLCRQFPEAVPALEIADAPAFSYRAMHIDSARHMLPIAELKKMMSVAGYFKINKLHWHISDDQGWRIECKAFPRLHEIGSRRKGDHFGGYRSDVEEGGYYTREEVKDFVDFCAQQGIEVVPEIDIPGHVMAILAAYPQLSCFGYPVEVHTKAAISQDIFCAGKEEVYEFMEILLDDMLELFPGKWFHIGGDEAPKKNWHTCPHCQKKMEQEGLASYRELQGYMMNRVAAFLRSRGRRSIVWNDGAYGGNLDKDIVLQVWFPDQDSAVDNHVAKGGQLIASPVDVCYCDYPHGEHPLMPIHQLPLAEDGTVIGSETLHWSEFIRTPERLQVLAWPRGAAIAEACWCGGNRSSYADFKERLEAIFPVFAEMGMETTPVEHWDPDEAEAQRQSKEFRIQFESESEEQDYEGLLELM